MATFDHLCETFPDENCVLTNREILVEVTTCIFYTYTCGRTWTEDERRKLLLVPSVLEIVRTVLPSGYLYLELSPQRIKEYNNECTAGRHYQDSSWNVQQEPCLTSHKTCFTCICASWVCNYSWMMINVNCGKLKPDKQTWTEKHLLKTSLESVLLLKIPATNTNTVT